MPRGPQPGDARLFAPAEHAALRGAVEDLAWLLGRGYAWPSSLKLVGDRHGLNARQQIAVRRATCTDTARRHRADARRADVSGQRLEVDGFNVLITIESALRGAVLIRGRDGAIRDLASVHGTYRRGEATREAIEVLGRVLDEAAPRSVHWYFDRPVSNSGRAAQWIRDAGADRPWSAETVADPDRVLSQSDAIVATSDAQILDAAESWFDLVGTAVAKLDDAWLVDLGTGPDEPDAPSL